MPCRFGVAVEFHLGKTNGKRDKLAPEPARRVRRIFSRPYHAINMACLLFLFSAYAVGKICFRIQLAARRDMRRLGLQVLAVSSFFLLFGCGSGVHIEGLVVAVAGVFSSIQVGSAPVTLTASVNDFGRSGVKWSLTLGGVSCSPGCGTLSAPSSNPNYSIVYNPPATAPLNTNATITATSLADKTAIFAFNFTIIPGPTVVINNKFMAQYAGGPAVSVSATVQNDSTNSGVTWTLTTGGTSCSPACGTLTSGAAPTITATYAPPATLPTGANASPTITAALVVKPAVTDSFTFNIVAATALFKGSYAFLVRGYDVTGSPMAMAGSVTADGNGNITAGDLDINNGGGLTSLPTPITGNYSIDLSFNEAIRGTFTITSFDFGGPTYLSMKFTLSSDGTTGSILELDGIGFRNVGTIQLQDPSALTAATPAGTYVFGLDSDAPVGGRTVEAGQFILAAGGVTGGLVDESKAADATPRYSAAPVTSGPVTTPDSSGRGTLTLNVSATPPGPASSTLYAYYIVNANQLNLLEIDSGATFGVVQAGVARIQKPLTASSVNTLSVLQFTGMDAIPGTSSGIGPDVIIGLLKISGGNLFNLTFDSNDLGKILTTHTDAGYVSFDPTTGRGVLSAPGGFQESFVSSAVFYLSDAGQGFIIDADPSTPDGTPPDQATTNNAFSGTFTPQAAGPFAATTLSNNLIFTSGASVIPAIPSIEGVIKVNSTAGTYTGLADLTAPDPIDNLPNGSFRGNYSFVNTTLGHGVIQLPEQVYGDFTSSLMYPASFFIIGPNQFVSIGVQNSTYSGISFFAPQ